MRRVELRTALPAGVPEAWDFFLDTGRWSEWSTLVVSAEGRFEPGAVWHMELRGQGAPRSMRPRFVSIERARSIVFETRVLGAWWVRMVHRFDFEADGTDRAILWQRLAVTGMGVPVLWPLLERGMGQFSQLGEDLAAGLAARGQVVPRG
jgi:hypothetical protein